MDPHELDAALSHIEAEEATVNAMTCFRVVAGGVDEEGNEIPSFITGYLTLPKAIEMYDRASRLAFRRIECQGYTIIEWRRLP